ncbi:Ketol-acid reductoisomerase (NADP(+)) [Buchnera aphidicola (Cinara kochiana kochiana)]|uniref:Ketol-acid reductoisomerase (NADP(+)) n=1 Tax=Buchnera aphidicola (Cinara kochiana kochiana) TaxID=2518976 RepID=A0A451D609_9GAMM|nr:ketol-acid reductoisomerase [Buchnera aphidicola]VFP81290.1 Ketol-acid reductoisomerase (NADP(+)) [Buchnera aphidicola (Cinara kochiana kochiana)]
MKNFFNSLSFREKLINLSTGFLMNQSEFLNSKEILKNKNIVIVGCGAQGLNQGLNLRDSGFKVSFALRKNSIINKSTSWNNAIRNNFCVDTYKKLVPDADLVINLTPDKQHSKVVRKLQTLMKKNSTLGYSHGFNIVEEGEKIRSDITVIMVAPKCPGTEVRQEFLNGFGVPALIAVHQENDLQLNGLNIAKSWAIGLGSHKAGVLRSSFIAEVKSDLMGEQTILCGMLQACSLVCYQHLISKGYSSDYSATLLQFGWEKLAECMKVGGIKLLFDRLSGPTKVRAYNLSIKLKTILKPLFCLHMDNIISGNFSKKMMSDWKQGDLKLIQWRKKLHKSSFENANLYSGREILDHEYFEKCTLMIAMLKAGVELSFETMIETGITPASAYYESLHELPLITNTIARKRLYEMNLIISDTAEYGSHLFSEKAIPILNNFIKTIRSSDLGECIKNDFISNQELMSINNFIKNHAIEKIGEQLRSYMTAMKSSTCLNN